MSVRLMWTAIPIAIGWLGCAGPRFPAPSLDRVEPAFAYNGEITAVTVYGTGLLPQIAIDARTGEAEVDRTYGAWLVGPDGAPEAWNTLLGVESLGAHALTATVPVGLAPGTYDLVVESGTGQRASLPASFGITSVQPARLELSATDTIAVAGDVIVATIALLDADDRIVPVDFDVVVAAAYTDAAVPGPIELDGGTLTDVSPIAKGQISGRLAQGTATVELSSAQVGNVVLAVEAADPDSEVIADSLIASFTPGADVYIELVLPPGEAFPAGEPIPTLARFVDGAGHPLDLHTTVVFATDCSAWVAKVDVDGETTFDVVPRIVTGPDCPEDRIRAVAGATGESAPYEVIAGALDHFNVTVAGATLVAGDPAQVSVVPVDANGNAADWFGNVNLTDSVGGIHSFSCGPSGADIDCEIVAVRAATGVVLTATAASGVSGTSDPYDVVAGDVPTKAILTALGPAVAGEALPLTVQVFDGWDNPMDGATLGPTAFAILDALGEVDCELTGFALDGTVEFDCVLYTAGPNALAAEVAAGAASIVSAPAGIQVENGPLAFVAVGGEGTEIAGEEFGLELVGTDAWDNPYLVQTDATVDLRDDTGTYTVATATLGATGAVVVDGAITRAGLTAVRVSQGGVDLGASDPFLVVANTPSALAVTPLGPWAWVGEALPVQVEIVDAYGNRADGDISATVNSDSASGPPVPVSIVNGVGETSFLWVESALPDLLIAAGNGWSGEAEVTVAEPCAADGPAIGVAFGGFPEAVACLDGAGAALVTADFATSTAGSTPLTWFGLAERGGTPVFAAAPTLDVVLDGAGAHDLWALVVDSAGCGAELETTGWAGPDDGTPVGPIALTTVDASVGVVDLVSIDVLGATDCARDPAAFQTLAVRATGGALGGVSATGAGLALALDAAGEGSVTLTTSGDLSEGLLEVHATVASGAAGGWLGLPVVGDDRRPIVVGQTPIGEALGVVNGATVTFSEPLFAPTVTAANFSLLGPTAVGISGAALIGDERTVQLAFSGPVDGSAGVYTIVATSSLRDVAGSKLSGDWSGLAADYRGAFGDVGLGPPAVSCPSFDPAGLALRPDGDDGAGPERDDLEIEVSAASAPAWWVVVVRDAGDEIVWQGRQVPVGASDTVSWEARGFDGLVAPPGAYSVEVYGDDGLGNPSAGCEVIATVENADGRPPAERP